MNRTALILMSSLILAGACDNDPGAGETTATVTEAVSAPEAPAAAEAVTETYVFSQDGSKVKFVGAKVTGKHEGEFKTFSGTVDLVENDPQKSVVKVEIDSASLVADEEKLTNHLKSPDFFDIEKFPKVTFVSTKVEPGGTDGATHTVTGNLELHGETKGITFPATIELGEGNVSTKAKFVINRKDFGLNYPGMPDNLIKDDVLIELDIHAAPKG